MSQQILIPQFEDFWPHSTKQLTQRLAARKSPVYDCADLSIMDHGIPAAKNTVHEGQGFLG